ncbi:MAG: hypothetical protein ACR2MT_03725 [Aurantibacter sp.]
MAQVDLNKNNSATLLLSHIALWALVESGLGGIMHAIKLPFTGIFLGGFAVLIIGSIAYISKNPAKDILKATVLVLLIKAAASPHTSPFAYVAVGFQGSLGALLFSKKSWIRFSCIPFATLSMIETSAQKLLILYLFFGKKFFESIDLFMDGVLGIFGLEKGYPYSTALVLVYLFIYAIFGVLLGIWILKLPQQLEKRKAWYVDIVPASSEAVYIKKKKRKKWWFLFGSLLLIILAFSYFVNPTKGLETGIYLILRTSLILLVWFFLVIPLWKNLFNYWRNKQGAKNSNLKLVGTELEEIRTYTGPLFQNLKQKYRGPKLVKEFVLGIMVLSFYRGR